MFQEYRKLQTLEAFQPFARVFRIYAPSNFASCDGRLLPRNIVEAIGWTINLIGFLLYAAYAVVFCSEQNFDLSAIAASLSIWLACVQSFSVYLSMSWSNRDVTVLIDGLQRITEKSEWPFLHNQNSKNVFWNHPKAGFQIQTLLGFAEIKGCFSLFFSLSFKQD